MPSLPKDEKLRRLGEVFQPRSPITSRDLFFGRIQQLEDVIDAVDERGQHVVLYGERGVGKTSSANILAEKYIGAVTAKFTCGSTDTFKRLWEGIFSRVAIKEVKDGAGFVPQKIEKTFQLDFFLEKDDASIDYNDILKVLENLKAPILFIFDEFDNIDSLKIRNQFADTIKALSDNAPYVTVVLVGVADNVSDLIGLHPSLLRCLKQVKLPLMSQEELSKIVLYGIGHLELEIAPEVLQDVIKFSQGFPHYTHLLSKYAAKSAILRDSNTIQRPDFEIAVDSAISDAHESIRQSYEKAVMTRKDVALYKEVLSACALVALDENGTFRATDLQEPLSKILKREVPLQAYLYHLGTLCQSKRGEILQKVGSESNFRYKFKNPLIKAYVSLMHYQKSHS
jgi:Cdc6-like AAA superfamily ATPase